MKEHPILFSGPMVQAILAGQKTQTRRIIKSHPGQVRSSALVPSGLEDSHGHELRCPYGVPGDQLWVRESWARSSEVYEDGILRSSICYAATPRVGIRVPGCIWDVDQMTYLDGSTPLESHGWGWPIKWRPSIHMPRWASRITLEITSVRVERINAIVEADIVAEGIDYLLEQRGLPQRIDYRRLEFFGLWEKINGKRVERDEYGDANPFVWVVEFKRL